MQRLFPAFPGGWPGIALLLLRAVLGVSLLFQGRCYLGAGNGVPVTWLAGLGALAAGVLLLMGFLTPVAGVVVGLGALGVALSVVPACTTTLFDSSTAVVFFVTMLIVVVVLGPGGFSVDARVFGRREIIIPPPISPSHR